uniref:Secreted protein n=1 Tax=Steinernema glaseri TaxID=37863 RepID=A0A1I8AEQ3_9BILA
MISTIGAKPFKAEVFCCLTCCFSLLPRAFHEIATWPIEIGSSTCPQHMLLDCSAITDNKEQLKDNKAMGDSEETRKNSWTPMWIS